jgi:cytochrome c peroxidase
VSLVQQRVLAVGLTLAGLTLTACEDASPPRHTPLAPTGQFVSTLPPELVAEVRQLAAGKGIGLLADAPKIRPQLVQLGQALAFDKELSGNRDISCMTCHLPPFATGDGRSLSIGQGATGIGPDRVHPQNVFIPRNAPSLFNLTAMRSLFWDGRVSQDENGTFHTPAGAQLTSNMTAVLEFGPPSALALFPVTSRAEMRGQSGNELAAIPDNDFQGIWAGLMARLGKIPEYRRMFEAAYPGTPFDQMTFAHAANAIGGFMVSKMTFNNSPWDRFLRGADDAMSLAQLNGAKTFLSIRCTQCHNGAAFTDNQFHNVAVAQLGPGAGDGLGGTDDFGRMRVTGSTADQYRFRTSPLRNIELTGPYGHDGAFISLHEFIDHYSESAMKLHNFDASVLEPLLRGTVQQTADAILGNRDPILDGVVLPASTVDELTTFMGALTDPSARNLGRLIPGRVPSGLPVDRR